MQGETYARRDGLGPKPLPPSPGSCGHRCLLQLQSSHDLAVHRGKGLTVPLTLASQDSLPHSWPPNQGSPLSSAHPETTAPECNSQ